MNDYVITYRLCVDYVSSPVFTLKSNGRLGTPTSTPQDPFPRTSVLFCSPGSGDGQVENVEVVVRVLVYRLMLNL